jgi:hypothetical protein
VVLVGAAWCLSANFPRYKINTRIIYLLSEQCKEIKSENINDVILYGIPAKGNPLAKRLIFYNNALQLIQRRSKSSESRILILHSAFALPLAKPLKKLNYKINLPHIRYTFERA